MKFCEECFINSEIRDIISSGHSKGNCDLDPNHKNVWICDIEKDTETVKNVRNFLRQIIDIYTLDSELPESFPESKKDLLKNSLEKRWSLFQIDSSKIHDLLSSLFDDDSRFDSRLLLEKVGVPAEFNTPSDKLIIEGNDWDNFVKAIQFSNRFHTKTINLKKLKYFLGYTSAILSKRSTKLLRCRISNNIQLKKKDLGAPPPNIASAGRLNPEWISVLYLSDSEQACIQEVRASFQDTVYIGRFSLKNDLKLIDLSEFDVVALNGEVDFLDYYLNRDVMIKISENFSKPTNNDFKLIDYLPLQYISEFIKSFEGDEKIDGIRYKSVMDEEALNIMLFDSNKANCNSVYSKKVSKVAYSIVNL